MDRIKRYMMISRVLDWIGNIWLILTCLLIVVGDIAFGFFQGWDKLMEALNPFNIWYIIGIVIILAPGIVLKIIAKRLKNKASIKQTLLPPFKG